MIKLRRLTEFGQTKLGLSKEIKTVYAAGMKPLNATPKRYMTIYGYWTNYENAKQFLLDDYNRYHDGIGQRYDLQVIELRLDDYADSMDDLATNMPWWETADRRRGHVLLSLMDAAKLDNEDKSNNVE